MISCGYGVVSFVHPYVLHEMHAGKLIGGGLLVWMLFWDACEEGLAPISLFFHFSSGVGVRA